MSKKLTRFFCALIFIAEPNFVVKILASKYAYADGTNAVCAQTLSDGSKFAQTNNR